MLNPATIRSRLQEMRENPAPRTLTLWDETCEGSGRALVVFVGPSPGGAKAQRRRPMNKKCIRPQWNEAYTEPLSWSSGFRASFQPLVEALFGLPFAKAGKLIARANLDWMANPDSADVSERSMHEGAPSTLRLIDHCAPEVILPMDWKTYRVLKEVMEEASYSIHDHQFEGFTVHISEGGTRQHRELYAHTATKKGRSLLIMKLPQHPARMFRSDYGTRCGIALREAALHLSGALKSQKNR